MSSPLADQITAAMMSPFTASEMCGTCGRTIPAHMKKGHIPSAEDETRAAPDIPSYRGGGDICPECGREQSVYMGSLLSSVNGPGSATFKPIGVLKVVQQPLVK